MYSNHSKLRPKLPLIFLNGSSLPAYSIFNPNEWSGRSKTIIQSCAAQYGLLHYSTQVLKNLFHNKETLCKAHLLTLKEQWERAKWDISQCDHLLEIPEVHLHIQGFHSIVKTFMDLIAQLISTENIVLKKIHGFHKKGKQIGGQLIHVLGTKANPPKKKVAIKLHRLISDQKPNWIDDAILLRDNFVHPDRGLAQVMFRLELGLDKDDVIVKKIMVPMVNDHTFDEYAEIILNKVTNFSKDFLQIIKNA